MKEIPVTFKSHGKQIVGMLHLPSRKNAPVIIMCHGYGGDKLGNNRRTFLKAARHFSKHGIAALRFDFMGCGDSEGEFAELTITEQIKNLQDAIKFLETIDSIDTSRIGVMGWSRGVAICILSAVREKRIKCVVSWAGEADFKDIWPNHYIKEVKARGKYYSLWWNFLITEKSFADERRYNILGAVRRMRKPFLVVHGTYDDNVTLNQGETLYKTAHKPKKIFVVKNADHSFTGFEKKVIDATFLWFKKWLK